MRRRLDETPGLAAIVQLAGRLAVLRRQAIAKDHVVICALAKNRLLKSRASLNRQGQKKDLKENQEEKRKERFHPIHSDNGKFQIGLSMALLGKESNRESGFSASPARKTERP